MKLNGNKTTIGAVAMVSVFVLRQAGVDTNEAEVLGWLAAIWTLYGLIHKVAKSIVKWDTE